MRRDAFFDQAFEIQQHASATYDGAGFASPGWAFFSARHDPSAARLALESMWAASFGARGEQTQDNTDTRDSFSRSQIAFAMSAVDLDRALEMARSLSGQGEQHVGWASQSPRAAALSQIALILLVPSELHWRSAFTAEMGFSDD